MDRPKHIIFIAGFMGSGKSTVGPHLARQINYDFVDIDEAIEEIERVSVSEIFEKYGEKYFREVERRTLDRISKSERKIVVALGGGTLGNELNRNLVKNDGILVYLKAEPAQILKRVRKKTNRPMLLGPDGVALSDKQLLERVELLLDEREKHYMEANIVVDTSGSTVSKTVEEIASKLQGRIE